MLICPLERAALTSAPVPLRFTIPVAPVRPIEIQLPAVMVPPDILATPVSPAPLPTKNCWPVILMLDVPDMFRMPTAGVPSLGASPIETGAPLVVLIVAVPLRFSTDGVVP